MSETRRRRELARADRVLPGLWRLRLPLPWPGVPHVNAFAIAAGNGVVLVDTGLYEPGGLRQLERALDQAGLRLEHVRLLVCTHAHSDHYGLAGPIVEAAGCELWMHPNHSHMSRAAADPERAFERRLEVARQSGVPADSLARYQAERQGRGYGIAEIVLPDRDLLPGVEVDTDLGRFAGVRDARARAVARGPSPARPRPAPVRGPSARPRVALLRLRLDAGPRRRVPPEPGRGGGPRRAAGACGARPAGARRAGARGGQPPRGRAPARRGPRRSRGRAAHPVRDRADAGGRGRLGRDGGELGPLTGAQLPGPPGVAGRGRARWTTAGTASAEPLGSLP